MPWNDESDRERDASRFGGSGREKEDDRYERERERLEGYPSAGPAMPGYYGGYAAPWYGPFPLGFGGMLDPYMSLGVGPGGYLSRQDWQRGQPRAHYGYGGGYMGPGDTRFDYRGRGPRDYRRADERIRDDVNDLLTDNAWVDASDVVVTVESGEVTLVGTVDSRRAKRIAEDIAEAVSGVRDVHNQLRVRGGARETEVERSTARESPPRHRAEAPTDTTEQGATPRKRETGSRRSRGGGPRSR